MYVFRIEIKIFYLVQVAYGVAAGWGKNSRLLPSSRDHTWLDLLVINMFVN
jgi:hypothetical protein